MEEDFGGAPALDEYAEDIAADGTSTKDAVDKMTANAPGKKM
jgi:hypothetical protein